MLIVKVGSTGKNTFFNIKRWWCLHRWGVVLVNGRTSEQKIKLNYCSDPSSSSPMCLFLAANAIRAWLIEKPVKGLGGEVVRGNGRKCPKAAWSRSGSSWNGFNDSINWTGGKCGLVAWLERKIKLFESVSLDIKVETSQTVFFGEAPDGFVKILQ